MFKRNQDIRKAKGNIPTWVIAERLGVHENTLHNWMKKEMCKKRKERIMSAIGAIKKELAEELDPAEENENKNSGSKSV
ncbi:hypothetical protein Q4S57_12385 [Priestia megaterium]|uniref:hypothetical protein n=1 Tax=Priestia megaterium TaxID=1404 RepID=UPI0026E3F237|nr:hypothetical protein [Priestia megaterium]MDO6848750.1 hypothetical protein [Priestia megaterium]